MKNLITKLLLLITALVFSRHCNAQIPQAIPYQAIARDSSGTLISNQNISLRFSIHDLTANGIVVYQETKSVVTNSLGLFTANIGQGIPVSGNFSAIHWESGMKFLQVEMDVNGGLNYVDMGTQQMLSVPYALYAPNTISSTIKAPFAILDTANNPAFSIDKDGESYHYDLEHFYGGIVMGDGAGNLVFSVDSNGNSFHAGREWFSGGVTVEPKFTVLDSARNPAFEIGENGESYHYGKEHFYGGIELLNADNEAVFAVDNLGNSYHAGHETFAYGATIGPYLTALDSAGNVSFQIGENGESYHYGMEHFYGGIELLNADNEAVFAVDNLGNSYHAGHETFAYGATIGPYLTALDSAGNVSFQIGENGESYHYGTEHFYGGIELLNSNNEAVFAVDTSGNSYHAGNEIFAGNTIFGDTSQQYIKINKDGSIQTIGPDGKVRMHIDPLGGIRVKDGDGNLMYALYFDGSSWHRGLEEFYGGIRVGNSSGPNCIIGSDGSIQINDSLGNPVFTVANDGTSTHKGRETFKDGINVGPANNMRVEPDGTILVSDANGNITTRFNPDGTSIHSGRELFINGIEVGSVFNGPIFRANADGSIEIVGTNGQPIFKVFPDGTSLHKGQETFLGGAIFGDSTSTHLKIGSDGSIEIVDDQGNTVYKVDKFGHSTHNNQEDFKSGFSVGADGSGHFNVSSNGSLAMINSAGDALFEILPNGDSYHRGQETFDGGITVNNSNLNVTGTGVINGNGSGVNNLNAGNLETGIVNDNRLSPNVVRTNAANTFNQTQTVMPFQPASDAVVGVAPGHLPGSSSGKAAMFYGDGGFTGTVTASTFVGDGAGANNFVGIGTGLMDLDAGNLSLGTVSDARLSTNIPQKNQTNTFSATQTFRPVGAGNDAVIGVAPGQVTSLPSGKAGKFYGDVSITGTLTKGAGTFKIDHPLDPKNKYLSHSFVESPEMMNIYNGNILLDSAGKATVELPDWFEALNMDFRYQLTCIGGFAPVYIEKVITGNHFTIAGGKEGLTVSWQVTGVRHDPYAEKHRVVVEEFKPAEERGTLLHPEAYVPDK